MFRLLEALCEEQLDEVGAAHLERLVLADPEARRMFVEYLSLHGLLHWDAAPDAGSVDIEAILRSGSMPVPVSPRRLRWTRTLVSAAAVLLVMGAAFLAGRHGQFGPPGPDQIAGQNPPAPQADEPPLPKIDLRSPEPAPPADSIARGAPARPAGSDPVVADGNIVAALDRLLEKSWAENSVAPSGMADDAEWLRRVSLDLCGRIPELSEVEAFVADRSPTKRMAAVDRLLNDPAYARHFATVWTNLLVGEIPSGGSIAKDSRSSFVNSSGTADPGQKR